MDALLWLLAGVALVWAVRVYFQRQRMALLGAYVGQFQIERLLQQLLEGYPAAAAEADPERQLWRWRQFEPAEAQLCTQCDQFAQRFGAVPDEQAMIVPLGIPALASVLPGKPVDMRHLLRIHAQGLRNASRHNPNDTAAQRKDQAYTMAAEILLLQHSCHWFCRSLTSSSARLQVQHQTSYEQVLAAVTPATRAAYAQAIQMA